MTSNDGEHVRTAFELVLAGDVMTGRGVDQLLPRPSSPEIFETYLRDARDYVALAEQRSGPIPRPVALEYPWGDALKELRRADVCIVNLETSVTRSDSAWPYKGINYRMHPDNIGCLTTAGIDVAVLANNHVLDWGREGLVETIETLRAAGLQTVGAGRNAGEAAELAMVEVGGRQRVLVAAIAEPGCGVPLTWAATPDEPGVWLFRDLDEATADALADRIQRVRRPGDVAVVSIHWGPNWGYEVKDDHVAFAHALVERGIDVLYGHSSHHPRPLEIVHGKPIFYGCGDLLTDYEGISGYEAFRNDLVLLYSLRFEAGDIDVRMKPFRLRKMRLECATLPDARWLRDVLARESRPYGTDIFMDAGGALEAQAHGGAG